MWESKVIIYKLSHGYQYYILSIIIAMNPMSYTETAPLLTFRRSPSFLGAEFGFQLIG